MNLIETVPAEPAGILAAWLPENASPDRPLMTVATLDDGVPDARTLLLSAWHDEGFVFNSDARSRKCAQLAANPAVALCIAIPDAGHQIVVQGVAERLTRGQEEAAYRARSPYLQQLAWQNTDEFAALGAEERLRLWAEFAAEHRDGFAMPETWVGYLVRPLRLRFWNACGETASRRVEYRRTDTAATIPAAQWSVSVHAG